MRKSIFNISKWLVILLVAVLPFSCAKESALTTVSGFTFNTTSDYVVLLGDIQNYTTSNNGYLNKVVNWLLASQAAGVHIKTVIQLGDITNFNNTSDWNNFRQIMAPLEQSIHVIYCTGNHDYGNNGTANVRETLFDGYENYADNSDYVASMQPQKFENSYFYLTLNKKQFLVLSLEFGPRDEVLQWADSIIKMNPQRMAVLVTHAYLYKNGERFDPTQLTNEHGLDPHSFGLCKNEKVNDGDEIWEKIIYPNPNVRFVFCGHMSSPDYIGNLISNNSSNDPVLQCLLDPQNLTNGGNGWIQLLEFPRSTSEVKISTYSPILHQWNTDSVANYTFVY